ncbi:MAG: hypothetical protein Q9214_004077 [Letrouitia sp. 1 TL-2023]
MEEHCILFNSSEAFEASENQEFVSYVQRIIGQDRFSPPRDASVKKLKSKVQHYATSNEATWLMHVLPILIKDSFTRKDGRGEGFTTHEWDDYGLFITKEQNFVGTVLPQKYNELNLPADLVDALRKKDGVVNPRPDICYGLRKQNLSELKPDHLVFTETTDLLLEISPGMHFPFLVIEGKGPKGTLMDAENQAQRAGACLLNAQRILLSRANESKAVGPDTRTFLFSATPGSDVIHIWVHWAEGRAGRSTRFHMNRVFTKTVFEEDSLAAIRRVLHNILQWGLIDRATHHRTLYKTICDSEPRLWDELAKDFEEAKEAEMEKKEKQKRKSTTIN